MIFQQYSSAYLRIDSANNEEGHVDEPEKEKNWYFAFELGHLQTVG